MKEGKEEEKKKTRFKGEEKGGLNHQYDFSGAKKANEKKKKT